jgi:uncharacterized protein YndB with AHSA1/START domain
MTIEKFEPENDGSWRYIHKDKDGNEYAFHGVIHEVTAPERIIQTFEFEGLLQKGHVTLETARFEALPGDRTKLTAQIVFQSVADRDGMLQSGMERGVNDSHERLDELLLKSTMTRTDREFAISRVFDAPRDLMFNMWTQSGHLMRWFGPKDFTMLSSELDLRPGGIFHYRLRSPDGSDMWGKFVYREISKPERLVFVVSFSDEKGNITRHPLSPTWPLEMLSTVRFAEHEGKTKITVQWTPLNATEEERKTFDTANESMKQGWTGTFDQLAEYLAKV